MVARKPTTKRILKTTTALPIHSKGVASSFQSVNSKKINKEIPTQIIEKITVKITSQTSTIVMIIILLIY